MKTLLVSDSPHATSAYALQGFELARRLQAAGYPTTYFGTTYHGLPFEREGVKVVGGATDLLGNDLLLTYAQREAADVIVLFKDPYVYQLDALQAVKDAGIPLVMLAEVDTEPVCEAVKQALSYSDYQIAVTHSGWQLLQAAGFKPFYAPHGVDTEQFCPGDKQTARAALGLPSDAFVAAFVGANQTNPSRKSLERIIAAWALFIQLDAQGARQYQDATLYLHTDLSPRRGGIQVENVLKYHGLEWPNWTAVDQVDYIGGLPANHLVNVYRAADVLLNPSMGGGFEVCCVEAQACGTPVIGCQFTGMRDTIWAGWKVNSAPQELADDLVYVEHFVGFRYRPRVTRLLQFIQQAALARGHPGLAQTARQGALQYDAAFVFHEYWLPTWKRLERKLQASVSLQAQPAIPEARLT